jgi:hypothetical protein
MAMERFDERMGIGWVFKKEKLSKIKEYERLLHEYHIYILLLGRDRKK